MKTTLSLFPILFLALLTQAHDDDAEKSVDHLKVTYHSTIKLTHVPTGYKLHSHDVKYGSGSGQQSITAFPEANDPNSYFIVKPAHGERAKRGGVIKCGSHVRLWHVSTEKFLHSHKHASPLSGEQEVSAYDGQDPLDNWIVQCQQRGDQVWMRDADVRLKHGETGRYLHASKDFMYRNPIPGQLEVSGIRSETRDTLWRAQEGIYFSDNPIMS